MSRLSRALWCLVPIRASFRPDGTMTWFGRWSFHRVARKLPKRDFIPATEQREPPANTVARPPEYRCPVHGDVFVVTVDYELSILACLTCGRPVEEVKPIQTDRPAP